MKGSEFERSFCIDAAHPSLPGHFPSHPLVPGVILLERVADALRDWRGQRLARVIEAKFMAPLLASETALLRLSHAGGVAPHSRVRFDIHKDGCLLARGVVEGAT